MWTARTTGWISLALWSVAVQHEGQQPEAIVIKTLALTGPFPCHYTKSVLLRLVVEDGAAVGRGWQEEKALECSYLRNPAPTPDDLTAGRAASGSAQPPMPRT